MGIFSNLISEGFNSKKSENVDWRNRPIMILLEDQIPHIIDKRSCIISKVAAIKNIAYIFDERRQQWYEINCLNAIVREIENSKIENINGWRYKTVREDNTLWGVANVICISASMWNGDLPYQIDDTFTRIVSQMNRDIKRFDLEVSISRIKFKVKYNEDIFTIEKMIKRIPMNSKISIWNNEKVEIKENWMKLYIYIKNSNEISDNAFLSKNTSNFTRTIYECPKCGEKLLKILIEEIYINVGKEKQRIDKIFACSCCNAFFAPVWGWNLNEGIVYYLLASRDRHDELIEILNNNPRKRNCD
ncbi:MAG: hypothetical protein ACRCTZ_01955 [Sarcina sp.]